MLEWSYASLRSHLDTSFLLAVRLSVRLYHANVIY